MTGNHRTGPIRAADDSQLAALPSGLAPPIRALAVESLPPRDRSVPATLCAMGGEVGLDATDRRSTPSADGLDRVLEPVTTAVVFLEGYVRLRLAFVADDGVAGSGGDTAYGATPDWLADLFDDDRLPIDRDAAILASDHLHSSAYATIADTPGPDRRRLELYRSLTEGSTTLTHALLRSAGQTERDDERTGPTGVDVTATLAGTAGALGAAAVGAPSETRRALRSYSHAVMTALASPETAAGTDIDPRERLVRILSADPSRWTTSDDEEIDVDTTAESHLERARDAVETLADSVDAGWSTDNGTETADSTPLERLERATRLPFRPS